MRKLGRRFKKAKGDFEKNGSLVHIRRVDKLIRVTNKFTRTISGARVYFYDYSVYLDKRKGILIYSGTVDMEKVGNRWILRPCGIYAQKDSGKQF